MSVAETVLQRFRAWAVAELGVDDEQVMLGARGPQVGPHAVSPCLVVEFFNLGVPQGTAYRETSGGVSVLIQMYVGGLQLMGFGLETADWLQQLALRAPTAPFDGFAIADIDTPLIDASRPQATGIEQVYIKELTISYAVRHESPAVAAAVVAVSVTPSP